MNTTEILKKIQSVRLCMMAHPDNTEGSEFEDRISDLKSIREALEQSPIDSVSSNFAVQKAHVNSIVSTYIKAIEEVPNGIYDPIEEALQEIQQKYLIIQKLK